MASVPAVGSVFVSKSMKVTLIFDPHFLFGGSADKFKSIKDETDEPLGEI